MRCYRKVLRISCKDHVTDEETCARIQLAIGLHENLLTIVKRRKLQWYGNASRSAGLTKTIKQGGITQGREKKRWEDNIREWTRLDSASSTGQWRTEKNEETGCEIICGAPTTLVVKG